VLDSVTKIAKPEAKISVRKSLHNTQRINSGSHHPLNYKTEFLTPPHKTRHLTPRVVLQHDFATVAQFYLFYLFIFFESLKNIVNHIKIKK